MDFLGGIRFNFENQENHLKYTMEYSHLIVDEDLGTKVNIQTDSSDI